MNTGQEGNRERGRQAGGNGR